VILLRSIRVRLTLWYTFVFALILVALGVALHFGVASDLNRNQDRELLRLARRFEQRMQGWDLYRVPTQHELQRAAVGMQAEEARRREASPDPDRQGYFRRPRVLSASGAPLLPFSERSPWDAAAFQRGLQGKEVLSTIVDAGDEARVVTVPIRRGERVIGALQMAAPLGPQERLVEGLTRRLLMLLPVALLIAFLGGIFLTDRALRPVRRVTKAAAELGARDLSHRLEVTTRDELGELAATFNGMLGRLEEAFRKMERAYAELERSYEQQRRFTGDASHELRTPLTRLKASTSLALQGERTPAEYRRALRTADEAADAMGRLAQDLLILARSDADQLQLRRRPVEVEAAFRRALAALPAADGRDVVIISPPAPLYADGDADQINRVLVNLLENALRHTPLDGRVWLRCGEEGSHVLLVVEDEGEGIPPEHLPHVCERFYRVDADRSRARGGSGLGLAIAQSLVQAHGGDLHVDSVLGSGTRVTVSLPRGAAVGEEEAAPALSSV
jgi:heavy metal sensor kinase